MEEFIGFPKIARLSREIIITEKIDGTNGVIYIGEQGEFLVGSRSRWITPASDNHGFATWAYEHKDELTEGLGCGRHFGEWWGQGIQRGYGLKEKRFSLFNTSRWRTQGCELEAKQEYLPSCCHVVPILYKGEFTTDAVGYCLKILAEGGSAAAPDFMKPEGVVVYHTAGNVCFKKTIEKDEEHKGAENG